MDASNALVIQPRSLESDQKTDNLNGRIQFAGSLPIIVCRACNRSCDAGYERKAGIPFPLWIPDTLHLPSKVMSHDEVVTIVRSLARIAPNDVPTNWTQRVRDGMSLLPARVIAKSAKRCTFLFPSRTLVSESFVARWDAARLMGADFVKIEHLVRGKRTDLNYYVMYVGERAGVVDDGVDVQCKACGTPWTSAVEPDIGTLSTSADVAYYGNTGIIIVSERFRAISDVDGETSNATFQPLSEFLIENKLK